MADCTAIDQEVVSTPNSRCVKIDLIGLCRYSTGSSMVTMWPAACLLRQSNIAAMEVDLPEPVAPARISRPRGFMANSFKPCGNFKSSTVKILVVIRRQTMPMRPCSWYALTRKRMPSLDVAE